jgi:hypothetical protein
MVVATMSQGLVFLGDTASAVALACALSFGGWKTWRGDVLVPSDPSPGRVTASIAFALASLPVWLIAAKLTLIALAAFECAPDAYECPL